MKYPGQGILESRVQHHRHDQTWRQYDKYQPKHYTCILVKKTEESFKYVVMS